jgi:hypothetical protein
VIPSFLRRFGAALVCCLALAVASVPLALATDAATAKPDAATAKPDAAATAKPDAATANPDAAATAKPGAATAKPDAATAKPDAATSKAPAATPPAATRLQTSLEARAEAEKEGRRHGARSKAADGTLLVWDNVNFVWIATEPKNTYWVGDHYFRFDEGIWLTSNLAKGPWEMTAAHLVPEAPRGRHGDPKETVTATLPSGLEAIYDPRIRVFKIAGKKGVFLFDGAFYRYDGGVWLESKSADGPWTHTSSVGLPAALRRAVAQPEQGTRVTLPSGDVLVSEGLPNLFAVEARPDAVYFDGAFYERRNQKWFKTTNLASDWEEVTKIPPTVRSKYHKNPNKKGAQGKGADKKKHAGKDAASAKKKAAAE